MWTNRTINLRTLVTVVKQYIYVNNKKKNLYLNLNIVNQITKDGFKIEIMLLKNCRYLEYESQRKAICEKCHARTNFVLTYSFFNIFENWQMFYKCTFSVHFFSGSFFLSGKQHILLLQQYLQPFLLRFHI